MSPWRHSVEVRRRRRQAAVTLVLVLSLAGCLSLAPTYHRPALPVAERYPVDAPAPTGSPTDGARIDWHDVFADPDLREAIQTALRNNRDLRKSILQVRESRALRGIDRAARWPGLNATTEGIRAGLPDDLGGLQGLPGVLSAYDVTAGASWELDFWGRLRNQDAAAFESYLATDAGRRAFAVSLVSQVAGAWLQQRELDDRIALARRSIATRSESYRIVKRRYEEGAATRLELTQVETLLNQAETLGIQLEQERALNGHALGLLLGVSAPTTTRTGVFDTEDAVRIVAPDLPSQLLTQRPDIIAAEHRLEAAHANIGAARAAFFPQVTLTGNIGSASTELNGLFEAGTRTWTFMPAITLPIFTGGRLRSNLDLAEARRDIAVADYEATIQGAFRDVADALSRHQYLTRQVEIQRRALGAETERARLAQLRYESGAEAYLEVLDAQRDLLSAEQSLVQTQRALQSSRVSLFAALGGGTLGAGR
ncbi:MAG TPA: efflux transporter outer membrane subunit [Steroidobacteraceae bacterium]|nr:efflux transporter outer membrane subunit [Steroidobacteraceae bacterium]